MNDDNKNVTEKILPTNDAKNALKGALKGIPKSFLLKVIYFNYYFLIFIYALDYL